MCSTQHHLDMLMLYIKPTSHGLLKLMTSSLMLTAHGVTGVDILPVGQLLKVMSEHSMDIYRLNTHTICGISLITFYRHAASWRGCMECLQTYHQ